MKKNKIFFWDLFGIISASLCLINNFFFPIFSLITLKPAQVIFVYIGFTLINLLIIAKVIRKGNLLIDFILTNSIMVILFGSFIYTYLNIYINSIIWGYVGIIIGHYFNYKLNLKESYVHY